MGEVGATGNEDKEEGEYTKTRMKGTIMISNYLYVHLNLKEKLMKKSQKPTGTG